MKKQIEIRHFLSSQILSKRIKILLMRIRKKTPEIKNLELQIKMEKTEQQEDIVKVEFDVSFKDFSIPKGRIICNSSTLTVKGEIKLNKESWIPFRDCLLISKKEKKMKKIFFQESKGLFIH